MNPDPTPPVVEQPATPEPFYEPAAVDEIAESFVTAYRGRNTDDIEHK